MEYCRESLALSPDFTGALLLLADCLWDTGRMAEAETCYDSIVNSGHELPEYAQQRLQLMDALFGSN